VSVDVEGSMYRYCREVGITLFTVSHRRSLWKHHEVITPHTRNVLVCFIYHKVNVLFTLMCHLTPHTFVTRIKQTLEPIYCSCYIIWVVSWTDKE
jgi:hypothetical protein